MSLKAGSTVHMINRKGLKKCLNCSDSEFWYKTGALEILVSSRNTIMEHFPSMTAVNYLGHWTDFDFCRPHLWWGIIGMLLNLPTRFTFAKAVFGCLQKENINKNNNSHKGQYLPNFELSVHSIELFPKQKVNMEITQTLSTQFSACNALATLLRNWISISSYRIIVRHTIKW